MKIVFKKLILLACCFLMFVDSQALEVRSIEDQYSSSSGKITKLTAWWGTENTWIEVTHKYASCIGQYYCYINGVNIKNLTDPYPGKQKRLYLHGECSNGRTFLREISPFVFFAYLLEGIKDRIGYVICRTIPG